MQISQEAKATATFINGQSLEGKISFIASAANPETRTFQIEISSDNPGYLIKEGLTANLRIPVAEKMAYRISPSILSLADDGTVGVKTVNEQDVVQFVPVNMLKDTVDFLWIGGLPDKARVITVGQDFVMPGEKVKPVLSEGSGLL